MPKQTPEDSVVLLDACCLINLLATGRIEEILESLPYRFATSRLVAEAEVLSLASSPGNESSQEREIISLELLTSLKNLNILDLSTDEELTCFIRFAADLDDGEASVCALAVTRSGIVATDDRKALRLLGRTFPPIGVLQTPEILWEWAQRRSVPATEVSKALVEVRQRARFYPRRDAPQFAWWDRFF